MKRALAADPTARFASMDELVAALGRDPRRRRRATGVAVGALLIGCAVGAVVVRLQAGGAAVDPCGGGEARVGAVWNAARSDEVRKQLGATAWAQVAEAALEQHVTRWEASFRGVCEATRVRGDQSDRLLELRMRCLDRALDRFGALAGGLAGPLDAAARTEAASAIAQLPQPEACATLTDEAELALPADLGRRTRALGAEGALDRAWVAYSLGKYRDARARIAAIDAATRDLDDAPALRAAVLMLLGVTESRIGEPAAARAALDRALAAAAAARASDLELAVWARLLRHELFAGIPARTIEWSTFARAAAARAGRDGAEIEGVIAEAQRDAGQLAAARVRLQRALASRDPLRPDQRAVLELNLGSIDLAFGASGRAHAAFDRAYQLSLAMLGDEHPSLALYLDKLAEADRARGRIRDALARHDRSVALRRAAFGDRDRAVATALFHRGETEIEAGLLDRAARDLDDARSLRAALLGERSPRLGEIDAALGDLAAAAGRFDDARTLYERATTLDRRLDLDAARWRVDHDPTHTNPTPTPTAPTPTAPTPTAPTPTAPTHTAPTPTAPTPTAPTPTAPLTPGEPLSIDRAATLAMRAVQERGSSGATIAATLLAYWRAVGGNLDAALTLAIADALLGTGDRTDAAQLYDAAVHALADEPSRTRLRAYRGLATAADGERATTARASAAQLAAALPQLAR